MRSSLNSGKRANKRANKRWEIEELEIRRTRRKTVR
jgi:hypothetical protein